MTREEAKQQVRQIIEERKKAYERVFASNDPSVRIVLEDLSRFCREHTSCFHPDPRIHARLEGRREIMLRLRRYTNLSVDELCKNLEEQSDGG